MTMILTDSKLIFADILSKRKQIRLSGYDYSQKGLYYITICTQNRQCLFGNIVNNNIVLNNIGNIIKNVLESLPNRFPIILNIYQIMPNHIHTIIKIVGAHHDAPALNYDLHPTDLNIPTNRAIRESPLQTLSKRSLLSKILGYFKMNSTKQIRILLKNNNLLVWQRNYYEHIIRNESELIKIREYIKTNPEIWERDRNNPEIKST